MRQLLLTLICMVCFSGNMLGQETFPANRFADRYMNSAASKKVDQDRPRIGKYAERHAMYKGETLQEAIARTTSPMQTAVVDDFDPAFSTTYSWGTTFGIDPGTNVPVSLYYTQEMERVDGWYYSKATFTFYDKDFKQLYSFSFDLPHKCNSVILSEDFSGALWDTSASNFEFVIMVHYFDEPSGPETQRYDHFVYRQDGTLLTTLSDVQGVLQYYDANRSRIIVDRWLGYAAETVKLEVYESRKYIAAEEPEVKASYEFEMGRTVNIAGPMLDTRVVDGKTYYYIASYELPYWAVKNPDWIVQQDNKFMVDFYDISDYTKAKTFSVDMPQENTATPVEGLFGTHFRDYDVTTKVFNDDDKWEFIFSTNQYITSCDCHRPIYSLYNENGEILKTFPHMVESAIKLTDLPGFEPQYAFFHDNGDGITAISFFDLFSWDVVSTFEARHNGEMLTLDFDRYAKGNDDYVYVFSMAESFEEDGVRFNKVNWYNKDGSLYKDHRFYLKDTEHFFQPMVSANTLNPFLFNTDEKMEYVGFCGIYNSAGGTDVAFRIYNEDDEVIFEAADNDKGRVSAGLYTVSDGAQWEYLIISYSSTQERDYFYYKLPLFSFEAGSGTLEDPYEIYTAGDLDLIRNNPTASYVLANDIDMSPLLNTKYLKGWKPIPSFTGTLDGNGHTIRNFNIAGNPNSRLALIESFGVNNANAWIKNLSIEDSELKLSSKNTGGVAFLVSQMSGDVNDSYELFIENVHIKGRISDDGSSFPSYGEVGALVSYAGYFARITGCSFDGEIMVDASASTSANLSGLVSRINNDVLVESSFSKGAISSNTTGGIGGIVADFARNSTISNCYSTMDITGTSKLGGIVGSFSPSENKGLIENCYATGTILSENAGNFDFAGGVVGSTTPNYDHMTMVWAPDWSSYEMVVEKTKPNQIGLVALNDKVTATNANRVSGISQAGINEIMPDLGVATLDSIKNCYAIETMLIGKLGEEAAISSDNDCYIDGKDIAATALTKDFYTGIGWKFGEDNTAPWVWIENGNPRLYTEFMVRSIAIDQEYVVIDLDETVQLFATVMPEEAWNKNVSWTSSDNNIATVNADGLVTGITFGTVVITATAEDGGYTATCEVKVGKIEGIELNKTKLTLVAGKDETLVVTSTPEGAAMGDLTWASSSKAIALVDSNGRVTGVSIGTVTVTVTMDGTDISATCEVEVIGAESIALNKETLTLEVGKKETLVATIEPADGLYTDLTWESLNNNIATVNAFGMVTAVAEGTCTIKVKLDGTDLFATCELSVEPGVGIDQVADGSFIIALVDNMIQVKANTTIEAVYVYNVNGQLVHAVNTASELVSIPVAGWNKGVYLVKAMSKVNQENQRIIVK